MSPIIMKLPGYSDSAKELWLIISSPLLWTGHFLFCYIFAAVYCAKATSPESDLFVVRNSILLATILALGGIAVVGWYGYRRNDSPHERAPYNENTRIDRYRFVGFATLLLSGLSFVAVSYVAIVAWFFPNCH